MDNLWLELPWWFLFPTASGNEHLILKSRRNGIIEKVINFVIIFKPDFALSMVRVLPAAALGLLMLGLVLCFWLSWRGAKPLETVANGLDALAQGQTVRLPTDGFAGELAEKLNQTGAQLQAKNEMLSRRDNARTQWIAGVSHDVRTRWR